VTHAVPPGDGDELVLAGDGDGEELVAAGVGELVCVGDGEELAVAGDGDGDGDDRHRRWPCGLQVARAPAEVTRAPSEELCAARAIGMVKPVTRAAARTAMTARAGIGLMKPRP
jgi:hypothetical protein